MIISYLAVFTGCGVRQRFRIGAETGFDITDKCFRRDAVVSAHMRKRQRMPVLRAAALPVRRTGVLNACWSMSVSAHVWKRWRLEIPLPEAVDGFQEPVIRVRRWLIVRRALVTASRRAGRPFGPPRARCLSILS